MLIFRFLQKYLFAKDYNYLTHEEIYKILGLKIKFRNDYFAKLEDRIAANNKILNLISNVSNVPQAKGKLREHQIECLNILSIFKNICEKNNLGYWLDAGTLLGAVRHKGMIPWDSDIDTGMMREDCYKLLPVLKEEFKDSAYIVRETTGKCNFQIRICRKDNAECGIDIFPFDKYFSSKIDEKERKEISKSIRKARGMLNYLHYFLPSVTQNISKTRTVMKFLIDKMVLKGKKPEIEKPAILFGLDFAFNIPGDMVLDYDTIFPLKKIEFEGDMYLCPSNIHKYLVNYYGNHYMQYPPKFKNGEDKIDEYIDSLIENKLFNI